MRGRAVLAATVLVLNGFTTLVWAQSQEQGYGRIEAGGYAQAGDEGGVLPDDGTNPGRDYVRVDVFPLSLEVGVPGFWRLRVRPGFTWVDGRLENDVFIPGAWRPKQTRGKDWAWVGGHWAGRRWIAGFWRPSARRGFTWVEGHWNRNGEWQEGFWRPLEVAARGMVWEPGFWGPKGWVEGFWRPEARVGFLWIGGERDENGAWNKGRWQPAKRNDFWVRGYFDRQGRKVPGHVVQINDRKAPFTPGHYNHRGEWVEPRWGEQRREERRENLREDRRGDRRDDMRDEHRSDRREDYREDRRDRREDTREDRRDDHRGRDEQRRDDRYSGNDDRGHHQEPVSPRENEQVNAYMQNRQGGQVRPIGNSKQNQGQGQGGGAQTQPQPVPTAVPVATAAPAPQGNIHQPPVSGNTDARNNNGNNGNNSADQGRFHQGQGNH